MDNIYNKNKQLTLTELDEIVITAALEFVYAWVCVCVWWMGHKVHTRLYQQNEEKIQL